MTAQIHEVLILEGQKTAMAFCPPLPEGHSRIFEPSGDQIAREPEDVLLFSTACWRGYQGTWEIKNGRFFLAALRGRFQLRPGEPVLADWFSGVLRVPRGEQLLFVHMGFGSIYEEEVHIKVENGIVVTTKVMDNREKPHDQWKIGRNNLPGSENRFPGDDELRASP